MTTTQTIDPSTGEVLRTFERTAPDEVEARVQAAHQAFGDWRRSAFSDRAAVLSRAARLLEERADDYARLMADEMGKPLAQGRSEANKCAWVCRFYAQHAEDFLAPRRVATDASRSFVRADPLGPVLAIMPWNFPFWQAFRFAAPALMAGNTVLLKHAENTLGCAEAITTLLADAGVPEGVFAWLAIDHETTAAVIGDDRVRAVTLTGSDRAGRAVASQAGEHLKKVVLELGGSDPFVVLGDADVARAAEVGATARLINSGQSCIAAKRFIVVEAVADAFLEQFAAELRARTVGDPRDPDTDVGPQARRDLRDELHDQVVGSIEGGATCRLGGELPDGDGFFYPVTLLTDVAPGQPAWDEEVFGPVAAVRVVADEAEALQAANDSRYGLGASLWTADTQRAAEELVPRIEAGCVFVNGLVKSDPRIPFGGVKDSGYGRELGDLGIAEFVNHKTVWIA